MGRRGITAKIDLRELERLCALQPTDEEIAAFFGISVRTVERRRKVPKFAEIMARGKAKGRLTVRRLQMRMLERGNATMGIWLGKQLLKQTDQIDHRVDGLPNVIRAIIMPKVWEVPPDVLNPPPRPAILPPETDADRRRRQLQDDYLALRKADRVASEEKYGTQGQDRKD